MPTYEFYVNCYLGTAIPEAAFLPVAKQAAAILERFKNLYVVQSPGAESEKLAICAMAETLYENARRGGGVSAARVGSMSVQYASSQSVNRQLYQKARIYLDIYRGVG